MTRITPLVTARRMVLAGVAVPAWSPPSHSSLLAWADPEKKTVEVIPFDTVLVNSCNGEELVDLVGEGRLVTYTTTKNDGTLVVKQKLSLQAEGVGLTSGAHYDYLEGAHITIHDGVPLPFSYTERRTQRMVAEGGVPDQFVSDYVRLEIDAEENVVTS